MPRFTLKLSDFFWLMVLAALCSLAWKTVSTLGWMAIIVSLTAVFYFVRHFRMSSESAPPSLMIVPLVWLCIFAGALLGGQHHPPFLAPGDFRWPPFQSIEERFGHALALSCWTLFWSPPTIAFCGLLRRAIWGEASTQRGSSGDDRSESEAR
jgi:hypothetical protein